MSIAQRRFNSEVSALIDRTIIVVTVDNKTYNGTLVGINPENLSLVLSDTKDPKGQMIPKVVLSGRIVARILSAEETFDLKGLAERLERVFPRMVKLYDNDGFIWVMDRVKVTEEGVVEGSGPAADRVATVYSQFVRDMRSE
jgi:small nuclear ribonucleoprotein (snRNP)-like protein